MSQPLPFMPDRIKFWTCNITDAGVVACGYVNPIISLNCLNLVCGAERKKGDYALNAKQGREGVFENKHQVHLWSPDEKRLIKLG